MGPKPSGLVAELLNLGGLPNILVRFSLVVLTVCITLRKYCAIVFLFARFSGYLQPMVFCLLGHPFRVCLGMNVVFGWVYGALDVCAVCAPSSGNLLVSCSSYIQ